MRHDLEYHISVRALLSLSVALLTAIVVVFCLALPAAAQINGAPASVTSPGFGGNAVNGTRSSVTSLGPQGYAPPQHFSAGVNGQNRGDGDRHHGQDVDGNGHRHHRQNSDFVGPIWYAVPVPYAVDNSAGGQSDDQPDESSNDADYQGGPTVFDRRGSGPGSYVPPAKNPAPAHATERSEAPAVDPDPPLAPTLLVFKDGHKLEIENYAIVGQTLHDLTPGHPRRIPIKDLDLEATRRQNDDRGIIFQLPQSTKVN